MHHCSRAKRIFSCSLLFLTIPSLPYHSLHQLVITTYLNLNLEACATRIFSLQQKRAAARQAQNGNEHNQYSNAIKNIYATTISLGNKVTLETRLHDMQTLPQQIPLTLFNPLDHSRPSPPPLQPLTHPTPTPPNPPTTASSQSSGRSSPRAP